MKGPRGPNFAGNKATNQSADGFPPHYTASDDSTFAFTWSEFGFIITQNIIMLVKLSTIQRATQGTEACACGEFASSIQYSSRIKK